MISLNRTALPDAAPLFTFPGGDPAAALVSGVELGPTAGELAEIEDEWPLIAAEIAVVEAETAILCAEPVPGELDWQRLRRARRRALREAAAYASRRASATSAGRAA